LQTQLGPTRISVERQNYLLGISSCFGVGSVYFHNQIAFVPFVEKLLKVTNRRWQRREPGALSQRAHNPIRVCDSNEKRTKLKEETQDGRSTRIIRADKGRNTILQ
jgi:hypothetical protein